MKNYFDFIMYLAFRTALAYENKRSITVEQLHSFRLKVCEKDIKHYSQFSGYDDKEFEKKLHYFHSSNIDMTEEEESEQLLQFIKENKKYFDYKDGVVSLNEGVTLDALEDESFELDSYSDKYDMLICGGLLGYFDCIECLDILGLTKVKDYVIKIVEAEQEIEKAYLTYTDVELEQHIHDLSKFVNYRLALIGNLSDEKMSCYHRAIRNLDLLDDEVIEFILLSDELQDKDEFFNLTPKYIWGILENKFQNAIFTPDTLAYERLNHILDNFWTFRYPEEDIEIEPIDPEAAAIRFDEHMKKLEAFEDEFEDEEDDLEEYDEDYDDEVDMIDIYMEDKKKNYAFYLNYINNINKYIEYCGDNQELEAVKNRLLYLLDSYGENLYLKENFNKALSNISMENIDYKDDFEDFYIASRVFLVDILEGWVDDELTPRKLLFASTYYDLTKDKRIKKIINKYRKTEKGKEISKFVLDGDYSGFTDTKLQNPKKMIKNKPNEDNQK